MIMDQNGRRWRHKDALLLMMSTEIYHNTNTSLIVITLPPTVTNQTVGLDDDAVQGQTPVLTWERMVIVALSALIVVGVGATITIYKCRQKTRRRRFALNQVELLRANSQHLGNRKHLGNRSKMPRRCQSSIYDEVDEIINVCAVQTNVVDGYTQFCNRRPEMDGVYLTVL